jgi:hypothetical protein
MNVRKLKFDLIAGPFGDETSQYSVSFQEQFTVRDFVLSVLEDSQKENNAHGWWGYFYIVDPHSSISTYIYEYRAGKLFYGKYISAEVADSYYGIHRDKIVTKLTAHGGWGSMDYYIYIEDNE